jgi:hypothetical protein
MAHRDIRVRRCKCAACYPALRRATCGVRLRRDTGSAAPADWRSNCHRLIFGRIRPAREVAPTPLRKSDIASHAAPHRPCRRWVKTGNPQNEQIFSAVPLKADSDNQCRCPASTTDLSAELFLMRGGENALPLFSVFHLPSRDHAGVSEGGEGGTAVVLETTCDTTSPSNAILFGRV